VSMLASAQAEKAMPVLDKHQEVVNQTPELLALKGRAQSALGNKAEGRATFAQAITTVRDYRTLLTITQQAVVALDQSTTRQLYKEALDNRQVKPAWGHIEIGRLEIESGQYGAAIERLRAIDPEVDEDTPERTAFNRLMAVCYL